MVAKPLFGSQGKGLRRLTNVTEARDFVQIVVDNRDVIYLQEFINHGGCDLRLLVVGKTVFAMKRHSTHWITNVSCGGTPKPHIANELEHKIAINAAAAVNGCIIGVDLIYDEQGQPNVVDVNSAPGWQAISATLDIDIACEILNFVARSSHTSLRENFRIC